LCRHTFLDQMGTSLLKITEAWVEWIVYLLKIIKGNIFDTESFKNSFLCLLI
jgi:hypothetical protein